jgi:cation diffusion facilitator CzcD-associated flavoprotein CzcO
MGNPRVLLVGGGVTAAAIAAQLSKATCRTVMHFSACKPTKGATLVGKIT